MALYLPAWGPRVTSAATSPKQLAGHVPAVVRNGSAHLVGHHPGSDTIDLTVGLALRNQSDLKQFLSNVSDPSSPQFRHYLTLDEVNETFNPTADQEQRVMAWLRRSGFAVTGTYPNHLEVDAHGTFAQAEQMLQVTLNDYTVSLPTGARTFYAPDREPTVPADVSDTAQTVIGLDNFYRPHLFSGGNGTANGNAPYYPQDIANAYDVNPLWNAGYNGSGQRIAIVLSERYLSDAALQSYAGTTGANVATQANGRLQVHPVDGGTTCNNYNGYPVIENAIDVEAASGLAPGATIDYYEIPSSDAQCDPTAQGAIDGLEAAGTNGNGFDEQISASWGFECEPSSPPDSFMVNTTNVFESNVASGHNYFFASGDSGTACTLTLPGGDPVATYPASSPWVTSVGGTVFAQNSFTVYPGEYTMTYCSPCGYGPTTQGSGGGFSQYFTQPTWQRGPGISPTNPPPLPGLLSGMRGYPDVAALADPRQGYFICYDDTTGSASCTPPGCNQGCPYSYRGWGTSLATPIWAGIMADVNQYLAAQGYPYGQGFLTPALYDLENYSPLYPPMHDVTSGINGSTNAQVTWASAAPGWDPATGWGSPDAWNLARDLAQVALQPMTASVVPQGSSGRVDIFYDRQYPYTTSGCSVPCPTDHLFHSWWNGTGWSIEDLGTPNGLPLQSHPAVVSSAPGRIDVFVIGSDRALYYRYCIVSGNSCSWSGWTSLGGILNNAVVAVSPSPGSMDIFALAWASSTPNSLWHIGTTNNWQTNTGWQWLGTSLSSLPSAVTTPWGIYVFGRGQNNDIVYVSGNGSGWYAPVSLGGGFASGPTAVYWTPSGQSGGRLDVYALGLDRAVWHRWTTDGSNWSVSGPAPYWSSTNGGTLISVPCVIVRGNSLDIFALGMDAALWQTSSSDGANWTGWQARTGRWTSAATGTYGGPGPEDVFARGVDGYLAHTGGNGTSFTSPADIGDGVIN